MKSFKILITLLLILLLIVTINSLINKKEDDVILIEEVEEVSFDEFSQEALLYVLDTINIKHKDIVFAQAILETGYFSSRIFKENNNLFGMKFPRVRNTTAYKKHNGHAKYQTWICSVLDYKLYQDFIKTNVDKKEDYYAFLSRNYAEDKRYVNKLKSIVNKLN